MLVNIVSESACSACHAKGACSAADYQDKEVEITSFARNYTPGEQITVIFKQSQGFAALLWGYIMDFILVLTTLIIASVLLENELLAGLISLGTLIPYYSALYFFRNSINRIFKFEIEENN